MKKLSDIEMQKIEGGNSYITAAFISSITRAGNCILDVGRSIGSAIRRIYEKSPIFIIFIHVILYLHSGT